MCLFTCLSTRAVQLEVIHHMNTDSFLMAWQRFYTRHGRPSTLFCDNGTNFVGGRKAMSNEESLVERKTRDKRSKSSEDDGLQHEVFAKRLASDGVQWRFPPPVSTTFRRCVGKTSKIMQSGVRNRIEK